MRLTNHKQAILATTVAIVALMAASIASAQTSNSVNVSNAVPAAGNTVTATGFCGTTAGGTVQFNLATAAGVTTNLGSTVTTANGAYSVNLVIPSTSASGAASLTATCPDGSVPTTGLAIQASSTASSGTTTPTGGVAAGKTNNDLLILGIVIAVIGATGLVWSRKIQTSSHVN